MGRAPGQVWGAETLCSALGAHGLFSSQGRGGIEGGLTQAWP